MPTAQVVGIPSATNIPVGIVDRVYGNIWADSGGPTNPNGITARFVGNLIGYHNISGISGFTGGFASTADHQHLLWIISSEATAQAAQFQEIYVSGSTGCAFVAHGRAAGASGTALASEHSIDTTATSPSGALSVGRVKFRFTASPAVSVGQVVIVTILSVPAAGIQAAQYTGVVATGPTLVSGLYEVEIDMEGLDALHWNAANAADSTAFNSIWSIAPMNTKLTGTASIASVVGDRSALDVTFTGSVPASVVVGEAFSILLKTGTSLTGLGTDFLYCASVQRIDGLVVRFRVKNARFNQWHTIGGSDSNTARFEIYLGVRDQNHDVPVGLCHSTHYRNTDGIPTGWIFGASDIDPAVTGAVIVGSGLVGRTSNEWLAGTSDSNYMSLVSDVLTLSKIKVGRTTGTTISGIRIASATLSGGTVTVADAGITENTVILPVRNVAAGTPGWLTTSRIASTSYTVTSSSGTDTSTIHVLLFEP